MLVVLSDTHGHDDARLTGRTREAVHEADTVVHAGDFTTETVLDAFHAAADRLHAVHGNNDPPAVCDRVPTRRVVEYGGVRFVVVHGHEHTEQALSLMAREAGADCVVVGHSHRPGLRRAGDLPVLNPGSHADPRRYQPAHAELWVPGDAPADAEGGEEGDTRETAGGPAGTGEAPAEPVTAETADAPDGTATGTPVLQGRLVRPDGALLGAFELGGRGPAGPG